MEETYFITFFNEDEFEWCVLSTDDREYAFRVFKDLSAPPGWNMELRSTEEDIETFRTYEVLRYDHSQFEVEG